MIGRQLHATITSINRYGQQMVEVDAADLDHDEGYLRTMVLAGPDRAKGARVGARVVLTYQRSGNMALWFAQHDHNPSEQR